MEVTATLGVHMLILGGVARAEREAREKLAHAVSSGAALAKFREIVAAQGGDVAVIDDPSRLPQAKFKISLLSPRDGYVRSVNAMTVALAALRLGAGRSRAEDAVDPAVGVANLVKVGEHVIAGAPLAVIHGNDEPTIAEARAMLEQAVAIGDEAPSMPALIDEIIS